jgi:hypothetical protein
MPNLYVFPDRLLDDCGQAALTKAICWPASVEPTKRRLYDGLLLRECLIPELAGLRLFTA